MPSTRWLLSLLPLLAAGMSSSALHAESMAEWEAHQNSKRDEATAQSGITHHNQAWSTSSPSTGGPIHYLTDAEKQAEQDAYDQRVADHQAAVEEYQRRQNDADYRARLVSEQQEDADKAAASRCDAQYARRKKEEQAAREKPWREEADLAVASIEGHAPGSPEVVAAFDKLQQLWKDGSAYATGAYGWLQLTGVGTPANPQRGRRWLEMAVRSHDPTAMIRLGMCCERGLGGPVDPLQARVWYRAAIACDPDGSPDAYRQLAAMDEAGVGASRDLEAAAHWYQLAARLGDPHARLRYADMLAGGLGVPLDRAAANQAYGQLVADPDPTTAEAAKAGVEATK